MASAGSMTTEEQGMTPTSLLELKSTFLCLIKSIEKIKAKHALKPPRKQQESGLMEAVKAGKLEVEKLKEELQYTASRMEQIIRKLEEEQWVSDQEADLVEEKIAKNAPRVFNKVEEIEQKYALIPPQTLEEVDELVEMRAVEHEMEETMRRMAQINIRGPALLLTVDEKLESTREMLGMIRELLDTIRFKEEVLELKCEHDELVDGGDPVKNKEDEDGIQE